MYFKVEPAIFQCLPTLYIGVVAADGVNNQKAYPAVEAMLAEAVEKAQTKFADMSVKKMQEIIPYREAFRAVGLNPNRFPCSVEAMFSRIVKGKGLPHINPLVDLNNALSLNHVIPMGTHDLSRSDADIEMRYASEGDTFIPFGSEQKEPVDAGEVVYAVGHEVRTRRWTWRQSECGKITEQTSRVFFPIDGFSDINKDQVDAVCAELTDILTCTFGCRTVSGYVDAAHPSFRLDI